MTTVSTVSELRLILELIVAAIVEIARGEIVAIHIGRIKHQVSTGLRLFGIVYYSNQLMEVLRIHRKRCPAQPFVGFLHLISIQQLSYIHTFLCDVLSDNVSCSFSAHSKSLQNILPACNTPIKAVRGHWGKYEISQVH